MISYAIKDADTGEYCTYAGKGWGLYYYPNAFSKNIEDAPLYRSTGPAQTLINSYKKGYSPRDISGGKRNLVIVPILVTYKEVK